MKSTINNQPQSSPVALTTISRGAILFTLFWTACYSFSGLDTFGITQLYPTKPGSFSWTSAHWNNGVERTIRYASDTGDPTDWTEDHSSGSDGFRIDGKGTMTMSGSGPRFHINSLDSSRVAPQFFRDVEFTAYYQRRGSAGQNWGGMVVGVRSGPLGHASPGGNECDATTYYARFRNDGKWDFEKELKHPGSVAGKREFLVYTVQGRFLKKGTTGATGEYSTVQVPNGVYIIRFIQ